MNTAQLFARMIYSPAKASGSDQQPGYLASHYNHARHGVRSYGCPAQAAVERAKRQPLAYVPGKEYCGAPCGLPAAPFGNNLRWIESTQAAGLRFVGYADDIAGLHHQGWYTDSARNDTTLRGAIWQWPARNGQVVLIAGYVEMDGRSETNPGGAALQWSLIRVDASDSDTIADLARDAAFAADGLAEWQAGRERDYNDSYARGRRAAEDGIEAQATRKALLPLIAEIRARRVSCGWESPAIYQALRDTIDSGLADIAGARQSLCEIWGNVATSQEPAFRAGFIDEAGLDGWMSFAPVAGWKPFLNEPPA